MAWIYFCGLQEKIGSEWPPRGQLGSSDLLHDEARLWRMGGCLSDSTWHLQAGPSASLQPSVLSLSSLPQAAAALPWKKIHQEEKRASGSESGQDVTGGMPCRTYLLWTQFMFRVCKYNSRLVTWQPGLCHLVSRMWPAGSWKDRDCHSAGYDLASLPTASVGQNAVQLPQSNCNKRPKNACFMCAKKGERPVSCFLYSTAAHPNPAHLIPLPHFPSIFLPHSSSSSYIERVTGRKAQGSPNGGNRLQVSDILSSRRKQTSVRFFSLLYTNLKRGLFKKSVLPWWHTVPPELNFSQTLS